MVYAGDMFELLDRLKVDRTVLIGTSMSGIMSMLMATMQPQRIPGIVLNDIGPEMPNAGLRRLRDSSNAGTQIYCFA